VTDGRRWNLYSVIADAIYLFDSKYKHSLSSPKRRYSLRFHNINQLTTENYDADDDDDDDDNNNTAIYLNFRTLKSLITAVDKALLMQPQAICSGIIQKTLAAGGYNFDLSMQLIKRHKIKSVGSCTL